MSDVVIRVENVSKLYRLGEVGTGSLAHDVNRWWHRVRGKEDPYLKIGEVNDRTKPAKQARADGGSRRTEGTTNHTNKHEKLTTEDTESTEGGAGGNQRADSGEFLEGHSQAGLQMDSEKLATIRSANATNASEDQNGSKSESAKISEICGRSSENFNLKTENSTPQAQSDWVYALKDVSFEVKRGEVLGIIGRNGAGKSTLLKILSRVTTQSSGQIKVKGRIASLLEVGTGFHPELTGRENIFLNGAILGMRKAEIARKFDEIVEFSGCARYIDTPVKRYSSGMYVRLAFAVAAHLEPEILIVDEVLAVGDAEFQKKCLGKMKDVAGHGRTILFVSHNMRAVQSLCNRALFLHNGTVKVDSSADRCIQEYLSMVGDVQSNIRLFTDKDAPQTEYLRVNSIVVECSSDNLNDSSGLFGLFTPLNVRIDFNIFEKKHFHFTLVFKYGPEEIAFTSGSLSSLDWMQAPGRYQATCRIPPELLNEGEYFLRLLAVENGTTAAFDLDNLVKFEIHDLSPRPVGSWHGKEPGAIRPKLEWIIK